MVEPHRRDSSVQALTRGLQILRMLVDEGNPLTTVEIGKRAGLHQSSVSRTLGTLAGLGYVRRTSVGFVPDYGILELATVAESLSLTTVPRPALEAAALAHPEAHFNLCLLRNGSMLYLVRAQAGVPTISFWWSRLPMNRSSAAMRILLDLDQDQALEILHASRKRHGWELTPPAPATPELSLTAARELLVADTLVLRDWTPGSTSGAIPLRNRDGVPLVLAISGLSTVVEPSDVRLLLHQTRRDLEPLLG